MLPVVLLFGIYGGVMTPTEGAAAAYALLASALIYRSISFKQLYTILLSSAKSTTSGNTSGPAAPKTCSGAGPRPVS